MIPFMYVCFFVSSLIYIQTPLLNEPLVGEDFYEILAVPDYKESFIRFPATVEYYQCSKFVKLVEIKF